MRRPADMSQATLQKIQEEMKGRPSLQQCLDGQALVGLHYSPSQKDCGMWIQLDLEKVSPLSRARFASVVDSVNLGGISVPKLLWVLEEFSLLVWKMHGNSEYRKCNTKPEQMAFLNSWSDKKRHEISRKLMHEHGLTFTHQNEEETNETE